MGFMLATSNVGGSALHQETRKVWREIIYSVSLHNAIKTEVVVHLDNRHWKCFGLGCCGLRALLMLIRLETICDENGQPITSLVDLLIDWSNKNNLLGKIFGDHSIHEKLLPEVLLCWPSPGMKTICWSNLESWYDEPTYSEILTL